MRGFKYTLVGFFGFLLVTTFNVMVAVLFYSSIENKNESYIAIMMLIVCIVNAIWCTIIDYIRRKIMMERPLNEILSATKLMSRGNFDINLKTNHSYGAYDEFDQIKIDINKMAGELSKSEMLKNDFIANVSHEIKTPLAVIQSYAKALNNKDLSEQDKKKYLDNLQDACTRLSSLITNILKLNKLENQALALELSRFNLSEVLAIQVLSFEELIESKNIELVCNIQEDLYINSEASYLEIVFNNLMSNAIKFTNENGKIEVDLHKNQNEYIISFKDTGCGMDPETGKHIFDKFYQGDTSHSKNGNGLGLALVKKVIDILGGKIIVESEINVGSTFTIIIKEV